MHRSLSSFAIAVVAFVVFAFTCQFSVLALLTAKDPASSQNGSNPPSACMDSFPTPYAVALNGNVTLASGSCVDYKGTYPNYSLTLQPSDKSFTLTVTPILWEFGNDVAETPPSFASRATILNLQFSSTNPNLKLQSFVIGGLTAPYTSPTAFPPYPAPAYVACSEFNLTFSAVSNSSGGTLPACTQPTMTGPSSLGTIAIEPTPITFADTNTTRWDIDGLVGSNPLASPLPSVDVVVPGFPSDINPDGGTNSPPVNNLTLAFMALQSNFLALAVNTSTGATETAGTLSIPTATETLTNDSISSPTTINPLTALTTGFTDELNISAATPLENTNGSQSDAPTNPADPVPTCVASALFRTVWYSFTPIGSGTITVNTANSRFDTVVAMYTGSPGSLAPVSGACDDDITTTTPYTHQAEISGIAVTAGTTYYILVGEAPPPAGFLNNSSGVETTTVQAAPLSNDATLFLNVTEIPNAAAAAYLAPSPTTLSYGYQEVGITSPEQMVTITSVGRANLTVSNISVPTAEGYKESDNCSSALATGANCSIGVTLDPTATGAAPGDLTFNTNDTSHASPSYPLSGTGTDFMFPTPTGAAATGTLTSTTNATYTLPVSGAAGFSSSISFACSNLPTNTQCGFMPNPATPGTGMTNVMLVVSRISNTSVVGAPKAFPVGPIVIFCLLLWLGFCGRRHTKLKLAYASMLFFGLALYAAGCGGGGGGGGGSAPVVQPTSGAYQFDVSATVSGEPAKIIQLTLQVM